MQGWNDVRGSVRFATLSQSLVAQNGRELLRVEDCGDGHEASDAGQSLPENIQDARLVLKATQEILEGFLSQPEPERPARPSLVVPIIRE
jgi:hypothetical protein